MLSSPHPALYLGQVLLLLGFVAVPHQLVDTEVGVGSIAKPNSCWRTRNFLHHQDVVQVPQSRSTVLHWEEKPHVNHHGTQHTCTRPLGWAVLTEIWDETAAGFGCWFLLFFISFVCFLWARHLWLSPSSQNLSFILKVQWHYFFITIDNDFCLWSIFHKYYMDKNIPKTCYQCLHNKESFLATISKCNVNTIMRIKS